MAGSRNGPETLCSKPNGLSIQSEVMAALIFSAVTESPGLQFSADVPLGRMLTKARSELRSEGGHWRQGPIKSTDCWRTQRRLKGAIGASKLVCDW
jgi:hypothetical protein